MANELPYFRFTVQAWQNGKIILEDYETQGLFINICGYYWIQDCSITLTMLHKRYKDATETLHKLISEDIIKHNSKTDFLTINFLNEQFDELSDKRKKRQMAGQLGGFSKSSKQKPSNATDLLEQTPIIAVAIREDNIKENKIREDIMSFDNFWDLYPVKVAKEKSRKKYESLSVKDKVSINLTLIKFISYKPFVKYNHPNPHTYLNEKRWLDMSTNKVEVKKTETVDPDNFIDYEQYKAACIRQGIDEELSTPEYYYSYGR